MPSRSRDEPGGDARPFHTPALLRLKSRRAGIWGRTYALQDANFNVLGLIESDGDLKERYEYTPYGERTVFKSCGSNDHLCSAPLMSSQPHGACPDLIGSLCDVGHQGLLHDKEFGLIHNRARTLHPRLGRFLQPDPVGYADGMSLYEYARSSPVKLSDPLGRNAAAAKEARDALASVHQRHIGYLYYKDNNYWRTGLYYLIWNKLNAALWWLDKNDYGYDPPEDAEASYDPFWNDMDIRRNPNPYAVMHEAIHVYNDKRDEHEDARTDEGLAYAVAEPPTAGMALNLERLQRVERALAAASHDLTELASAWRTAWIMIDVVGNPGMADKKPFTVSVDDVKLVDSYLGFKIRCHEIAKLYNNQPSAKKACVEFMCAPNAKPTKGVMWTALSPLRELHDPFK